MKRLPQILGLLLLVSSCREPWEPTALIDGYQIMIMNSQEAYVANAENELLLGPDIESIGLAPGVIVVNCGEREVVVNEFKNTAGFNVIDTTNGAIVRGLTAEGAAADLRSRGSSMPQMRPLASYLK